MILLDPCLQAKWGLMKVPLSANQSVNQNYFFKKTADRIFIKFHKNFWFLKDKKVIQSGKMLKDFWEKA